MSLLITDDLERVTSAKLLGVVFQGDILVNLF